MARRLALALLLALIVAAPAGGEDIHRKKRAIDERLAGLTTKLSHAKQQEGILTQEITLVDGKIRALQGDVQSAQAKLNTLDAQLAVHQRKLDRVTKVFQLQTKKLRLIRRSYALALARLQRRVLDAYETPAVGVVDVLLSATSMSSMLNDVEYVQTIGAQDKRISDQLHAAKLEMQRVRAHTRKLKAEAAREAAAMRARRDEQHAIAAELISNQQQLATARASKRSTLDAVKVNEQQFIAESNALKAESAALEAQIQAAQRASGTSGSGSTPAGGLIWPVQGPITSPFGPRCLPNGDCSSHPGIDISVASGTPIRAAAAGTVIFTGSDGGYGNLTVIDHGNGLSGCTGYCFGPHLHFEVRVNGVPVDPLKYL